MSDIFISYKREEQPVARKLADALEGEGWTVWWDPKLRAGEHFDDVIERALNGAKCVIVVWSEQSVQSRYVRDEATYALDRDKLVPVTIEKVTLPFRFSGVHTLSLLGWDGSKDFSEFRRLVDDISAILGPSPMAVSTAEEQRRLETEERRKVDEELFREQERHRFEEEAKRKADEEARNRAEQEAEQRRIEAETQRKAEERLRQQQRQQSEQEAKGKAEEENRRGIEQEVPSRWRTLYGPVAAAVAVVLILFSVVFWWPKRQEAPVKEAEGQKEAIKETPMVKPQPPPKEIVASAPEKKLETQKETIEQPPSAIKIQPEKQITATPQKKVEQKQEKPIVTQPVLSAGKVFRDRLKNGQEGPEMVVIPAGSFRMGDVQGGGKRERYELPVHTVKIQKPFAVGRYEVTFAEYDQFAKATNRKLPSDQGWGRGRRPVINVSWQDAVEYAKWLSEQTGKRYRLPTESEWEYAARGGKETAYWWGKDFMQGMANCNGCGSQWDNKQTAPVGSFKPNPFGLYDTESNVSEWVEDCKHYNYDDAPADGSAWKEKGGGDCSVRNLRGGAFDSEPVLLRTSERGGIGANFWNSYTGFRLAQDLD